MISSVYKSNNGVIVVCLEFPQQESILERSPPYSKHKEIRKYIYIYIYIYIRKYIYT